jgi:hypothetical protein
MVIWRSWLRFLAVAAAYVGAFLLARRIVPFSVWSPWFVLVAMICFLGLASVAHPLVDIRMPRPLRRIRAWEADKGLYRRLGVPAFGRLLRRTPLRMLNTGVYLDGGVRGAARVAAQIEAAEASHVWDALLVVPYMVYAGVTGAWMTVLGFTLAQVVLNAYPVMHLRLTRDRLGRLSGRKGRNGDRCVTRAELGPGAGSCL